MPRCSRWMFPAFSTRHTRPTHEIGSPPTCSRLRPMDIQGYQAQLGFSRREEAPATVATVCKVSAAQPLFAPMRVLETEHIKHPHATTSMCFVSIYFKAFFPQKDERAWHGIVASEMRYAILLTWRGLCLLIARWAVMSKRSLLQRPSH